jgi:C4-dicarboxylate-specific signal transduction histidine kinase
MTAFINAVEAVSGLGKGRGELLISTEAPLNGVLAGAPDWGPGLAPEALEHLLEVFDTTKSSGSGLGLKISVSIIEAHGGRLWASATSPAGLCFNSRCPFMRAAHHIS